MVNLPRFFGNKRLKSGTGTGTHTGTKMDRDFKNGMNYARGLIRLLPLLFLFGCAWRPSGEEYRCMYAHLDTIEPQCSMNETDYYLVILVDARHLDYTDNRSLLKTLAKHPSDGSKNGDVGHAWIYLHGIEDGHEVAIEGGHSGELGITQPIYFDGIMNYFEYGYADPTPEQRMHPRYEPNPIKYLWTVQRDGYFEEGSGNHVPTFAAKVDITEEQFNRIINLMSPDNYHYRDYAVTRNQCSTYVAQIAALADFPIECQITMSIDQSIKIAGTEYVLWKDPQYSSITFSTPDVLEKSLVQAVNEGRAEDALAWYKKRHPKRRTWGEFCESVRLFPARLCNILAIF